MPRLCLINDQLDFQLYVFSVSVCVCVCVCVCACVRACVRASVRARARILPIHIGCLGFSFSALNPVTSTADHGLGQDTAYNV